MTRKEELLLQMSNLSDIIDKKRSEVDFSKMKSFTEYENVAKTEVDQWSECSREYRTLKEPEMGEIPDYGDLFTLEDFIGNVECGGFIDYDGSGNYATETEMSDITIRPSDIRAGVYRKDFTHVVWFNK